MHRNTTAEDALKVPSSPLLAAHATLPPRRADSPRADFAAIGDLLCLMTCAAYQRQFLPATPLYPALISRIAEHLLTISRSRGTSKSFRRQCSRLFDHWEALINGASDADLPCANTAPADPLPPR
jgi:hypothetical protein